ncbi:urease accessory protein UreF [Anthocerotibacter panamensis]|uniref:urease accessory protein UreF n=1 Tax=Anthocerotibacter panamensis TaxID=2857077 RepID=UPI001C402E30|nr:urease accessory UreF family protein [Anthocerotibacter panamensis]
MSTTLFALLQLCDSALPIGGYSHSWGLETWVQEGVLTSGREVEAALQTLLYQSIAPQDGLACALAHRYGTQGELENFQRLNQYLSASRWALEPAQGSRLMGERLKRLVLELGWVDPFPAGEHHHAAVFGWLTGILEIRCAEAVTGYLFNTLNSHVSACVRLIPLGHTEGQKILARLQPTLQELVPVCLGGELEDLSGFAPLHEWACKEHESLYSRLFQS